MEADGRAVEADVERDRVPAEHPADGLLVGDLGDETAFLQLVVDVAVHGRFIPRPAGLVQSPLLEQGLDLRLAAAEALVEDHRLLGAAALQDVVPEGLGRGRVEEARLLEGLEGVRVQDLGPDVAVVAGRVAAGEDVAGNRGCGSGRRSRGSARSCPWTPSSNVGGRPARRPSVSVCQSMSRKQAARYSTVAKPWLKRPALLDLVDQRLRDGLARLVVLGVDLEDLGIAGPVLHDLGGQLDEVARHVGPGQRLVGHVREQVVQGVAELVEEGLDFLEGDERGLVGRRLGEVADVVDDGA